MGEAAEVRAVPLSELKELVRDPTELAKGAMLFDDGQLEHLSLHGNKLFADARGASSAPYKVQVVFGDPVKGRCSCMAARSRPFCKHAAGLLVAWARSPEAFVTTDAPPVAPGGEARRKVVKQGKTDTRELMRRGVEQMDTLLGELAVSGVAVLGSGRAEQIHSLGAALRDYRLRRLSARALRLSELALEAATDAARFEPAEYAELLCDAVLTVRKLQKHLGGEPLDDRHVEELIGRTWTRKDRAPVENLELVEYAFHARTTPDGFLIRESRFVDLGSGEHWSEKQILPAFLARRTEPKRSWAGLVLKGAAGSVYPSFPPRRLELSAPGTRLLLDDEALRRLVERALPDVGAALTAFQEHRKDVFAPDALPVTVAVDMVLAEGARMRVVDARDAALFLPDEARLEEQLAAVLRSSRLRGVLGDVVLDQGALPTLAPQAVVVEEAGRWALRPLLATEAALLPASPKVSKAQERKGPRRSSWADTARGAGSSPASVALGEVREELAQALVTGLPSVTLRLTGPLAARLRELGLAKQADLLEAAAQKADPAQKLDDLVKLYQVLGIALTRLAGATHVDRSKLVPVPTYESVQVLRRDERLPPQEIARRSAAGELNRYQAAVLYSAWYEAIPPEELARQLYPTWADGSASPYVAHAFAGRGPEALAAARRALELDRSHPHGPGERRPVARVARMTALRILEATGGPQAESLLTAFALRKDDPGLRAMASRALESLKARRGGTTPAEERQRQEQLEVLRLRLLSASTREERVLALGEAVVHGAVELIPALRASFAGDVSREVREAAAYALAQLGDTESVDTFVRLLRERSHDPSSAKVAAHALGYLGDVRGIEELLQAWEEGWQPGIVAEAMRHIGTAALEPLLERLEARPALAKRKAALGVLSSMQEGELEAALLARLDRLPSDSASVEKAMVLLGVAAVAPGAEKVCARRVLELWPQLGERGASREQRALHRRCTASLQ